MYTVEYSIPGAIEDILSFLERDNRLIGQRVHFSKDPNGQDLYINYQCIRADNMIAIHTKVYSTPPGKLGPRCYLDDPNGQGVEVIRFELSRITDARSLLKGLYEAENPYIASMFWARMTRLAKAFDAKWANEAQKEFLGQEHEVELIEGGHWGWTDWKIDEKTGMVSRIYGLIPNTPKASVDQTTAQETKRKGRYRLTDDEIRSRRQKVKEANKIKKADPQKRWKEIANELEIPERTLRDWRHNPLYQ